MPAMAHMTSRLPPTASLHASQLKPWRKPAARSRPAAPPRSSRAWSSAAVSGVGAAPGCVPGLLACLLACMKGFASAWATRLPRRPTPSLSETYIHICWCACGTSRSRARHWRGARACNALGGAPLLAHAQCRPAATPAFFPMAAVVDASRLTSCVPQPPSPPLPSPARARRPAEGAVQQAEQERCMRPSRSPRWPAPAAGARFKGVMTRTLRRG